MKFVTFRRTGRSPEAGVLAEDRVISLAGAGFADIISLAASGPEGLARAGSWTHNPPADAVIARGAVMLMAPVPRPPKLICVGLNYRDHAVESKMQIPSVPTIFNKFPTAVIGPEDRILLPRVSTRPDYEAEFAFVIGKGGRDIPAEQWKDHVFGYTIVNDVSARDYQMATTQWLMGKTFDTFAPMGPWIVSADEIPDPHALDISLSICGETLQSSNTRELIFKIPELIAHLSSVFTLEPGDVVATGTPAGVGFARNPPRYLKPGDEIVIRIESIGELKNQCAE
jgi:2-keto-4-pentenoate hydratase/2-oxohepta-3-ene-1,7-dioic acid hydratase in catechol pathway